MKVAFGKARGFETFSILPSSGYGQARVVVYHTGGGETAAVLGDKGNEKRDVFRRLSDAGYVITSTTPGPGHWGSPVALRANDALFELMHSRFGFSKVGILCQSMGGVSAYNWACRNPDLVVGIYGTYPVTDLASMLRGGLGKEIIKVYDSQGVDLRKDVARYNPIEQISSLTGAGIPARHRHGKADHLVEYEHNARIFAEAYKGLGGRFELVAPPRLGHEADPRFFDPREVLDFMEHLDWS